MATKEEALQYVRALAQSGTITKAELIAAYDSLSAGVSTDTEPSMGDMGKIGIAEILYYLGGGVVYLGIAILLAQNWAMLSIATKLLATLAAGIAAYIVGVVLDYSRSARSASPAFYFLSALTMPVGLYVLIDYLGYDTSGGGVLSLITGVMCAVFLTSFILSRKTLFAFFSIAYATIFFFSFTNYIISGSPLFDWHFYAYRALLVGISYVLLGYSVSKNKYAALSGFLYSFGSFAILGTALVLGEWRPEQNIFWELAYPFLVFGALYLSVYLKSKSFLTWGTVFLMGYILKITSEYFTSGLGWPLALVIAGLGMIAAGYLSLSLKRKYIG